MARLPCLLRTVMLALIASLACSCAPYYQAERDIADMLVPPQAEAALGAYLASQWEGTQFVPINDPESDGYLTRLGESILENSAPCPQRFTYHFIADPVPNAFAGPGGHVYVTSGLMEAMDSESELAAIVGHEVNHVVNRHGVRALLRSQWIAGAAKLAARASGGGGEDGEAVAGLVEGVISMHFSRDMEREADDTGITASFRTGYHPEGAVRIFQKFEAMESARGLSAEERVLSSHPDSGERARAVITKFQGEALGGDLKRDSEEFHLIRKRVIALAAKMPAPQRSGDGAAAAFCGLLPSVRMPAGGLASFGIAGVEQYAPPEYRPAQASEGGGTGGWDDDEEDDEEEDEEEDDDEGDEW